MIALALGCVALAVLLWAANAFARAPVGSVKALLAWVAALAGLSLAAMLLLTGKGPAAFYGLVLLGPLIWDYWQKYRDRAPSADPSADPSTSGAGARMGRAEALAVLGLAEGATEGDVRAAWVRLMRVVHPDGGGTDWLATRVNEARDVLLRR